MKPMKDPEELLQARLEQLEAGAPLEECLFGLPEEQAGLLRLVAGLGEAPYPERDPDIAAAQRARFLQGIGQRDNGQFAALRAAAAALRSLREGLRPRAALVGAVAALVVCVIVALLATGVLTSSPGGDATEIAAPEPAAGEAIAESPPLDPTPEKPIARQALPEATTTKPAVQSPQAEPGSGEPIAQEEPGESALESRFKAFFPVVYAPVIQDPAIAKLREPRGLVQVQATDGAWTAASAGTLVEAGQRVRTGALSSVRLLFNDGSQARLGPDTEVLVEELDAHQSDGPRIVVLTQLSGETEHDVATVTGYNSRYEVRTPSATGSARGTSFHVRVTSELLTHFSVDEGAVAVTSLNVTVRVVAGQATAVSAGEPPEEPAFRITGEGEVSQIGPTWIIAGHTFETHDATVIIGNPQVGDWVYVDGRLLVDGTRIADWIVLLRRSPANRFTITGRVDEKGEDEWMVAGQVIQVDEDTEIDEEIDLKDLVRVEGVILEEGALLAEEIHLLEEAPGHPFSFTGVVQEIYSDTWKISGIVITVDAETEIDEGIQVGHIVDVRGWILDDEDEVVWLARAIERAEDAERAFEITGLVDSIDPWSVAGIPFETREWTEIEPGIEKDDLVRVRGRILEDGTWVAHEIERLDHDEEEDGLHIVFVGAVDSIEPWVVSGIPLTVTDDTVIQGDIALENLVRVTVRILPDGTWLATRIELLEVGGGEEGCVYITAVVVAVGPGWAKPDNWPAVDLDGVSVEGEIRVGSVILMLVCVDAEGAIEVVSIVVIYQPEPVPPPEPPSPPPPPPPPPGHDEDAKVTICHRPPGNPDAAHTITISWSALQDHLAHGDTQGPCD